MEKEAPDEFDGIQLHYLVSAVIGIIPPSEEHRIIFNPYDAAVADGDAVGIAAEIAEHRIRVLKGRLQIDDPFLSMEPV